MQEHKREWDDLSNYVVHFTKKYSGSAEQLVAILTSSTIEARNPFGIAYKDPRAPKVVCLTETPIHKLARILERRGPYGIGFHKRYILGLGGGPVLYAYGPQVKAANGLIHGAGDDSPMWRLSAFIDPVGEKYAFEWEREWRTVGDIQFSVDDFSFLVMPEGEHERFIEWAGNQIDIGNMPPYSCPLIDASWSKERIDEVLHNRPEPPNFG